MDWKLIYVLSVLAIATTIGFTYNLPVDHPLFGLVAIYICSGIVVFLWWMFDLFEGE